MTLLTDIKNTIKYAERFGGKLTLKQLHFRLLSRKKYGLEEIKGKISNFQFLISKNGENNKKIKLAKDLVKNHLLKFKNILFVGITGSVAAENSKINEDIDIFIICKKDTMWLTRLLLRIYIKINRIPHRQYGKIERPNDFCFNLWMDEDNLIIPKLKQNQKNAVDLILIKVLLNKNNIFEKLIVKNNWAKKYVANGYGLLAISNFQSTISKGDAGIIKKVLNYLAFVGQIIYIRLKGPVKFINLRQAFFHR